MDRDEHEAKIKALLDALEEGERSGDPQPHDEVFARVGLELGPIATQWASFEKYVLQARFQEPFKKEIRRAFYAGAAATLPLFAKMEGLDNEAFEKLSDEIKAWAQGLARGEV